jgi:fatty-acyl-CoA synthase
MSEEREKPPPPKSEPGSSAPLKSWVRALEMTAPIGQNPTVTLPVLIDTLADKFETSEALTGEDRRLTYRELAQQCNRYSRWAVSHGIRFGDVVCLIMPNCPEYLAIWLGLTRVGAIVALINTNLSGQSLAHSINIAKPRHVIVAAELAEAVAEIRSRLADGIDYWIDGEGGDRFARGDRFSWRDRFAEIDEEVRGLTDARLDESAFRAPTISDCALYIYTSGTTGLPKAARVSHFRLMQWSHWFAGLIDTQSSDRIYNCLPMYHSVGGVVATGAALVNGGTVVLRRRFSASSFWDDVVESRCTIFQYIGELCRYLVNSPPRPHETDHQLRLCCGNGMRADIWEKFKSRFQIPRILEFYAATESNFSLYNCEDKTGAIGRIPSFLAHRFPVALVKFDVEAGEPIRNDQGLCLRCSANEVGEAIGKIPGGRSSEGSRFEGYTDKEASAKKVLLKVFEEGDAWYRTGDLMRKDEKGYYYFVDRVGDTFRWKGENVSTAEVAEAIATCPGVAEAVVYGVAVPGTEGRAGMAAIVVDDAFDLAVLCAHLAESLPEYARPLFLRIRGEIVVTETFKPRKGDLSRDGFDPAASADEIFFYDRDSEGFIKVDAALHDRILNRKVRL